MPKWAWLVCAMPPSCGNASDVSEPPGRAVIVADGADAQSRSPTDGRAAADTTDQSRSGDGGATRPSTPDPFAGAPSFASRMGDTSHNPGLSCNTNGCHQFLIGGTIYKDYEGTVPAAGVEVRLRDANGSVLSVYTGPNGNFHLDPGSSFTFPAIVGARDATTVRPMVTTLFDGMGSCAAAGCHVTGGTPASGAYYPIHVP